MHLADAFIQSDLKCIQAIHLYWTVCTNFHEYSIIWLLLKHISDIFPPQGHFVLLYKAMFVLSLLNECVNFYIKFLHCIIKTSWNKKCNYKNVWYLL